MPQPEWRVGGLHIHAFGIAVVLALNAGYFIALWRARTLGMDQRTVARIYLMGGLACIVAGHIAYQLAIDAPMHWLQVWKGQSSLGAAIGALVSGVAAALYLQRNGEDPRRYLNTYAFVFAFVWTGIRIGCALAHDHLGRFTTSMLGVQFPMGTRFDLGLLECLSGIALCAAFLTAAYRGYSNFLPALLVAVAAIRLALQPFQMGPNRPGEATLYAGMLATGLALTIRDRRVQHILVRCIAVNHRRSLRLIAKFNKHTPQRQFSPRKSTQA